MTAITRFKLLTLATCMAGFAAPAAVHAADNGGTVYVAHLQAMNGKVAGGDASGQARFTLDGDTLTIRIDMKGVPPNIEHWQHFHGFKDNRDASCPGASADANHDGIVDLIETEPAAGTTMVPFNADPAAMNVAADTYPKASADGTYHYEQKVSMKALQAAFAKGFGGAELDLQRRVVFIHGVPKATPLPASVASLGPVPAHVTLPIACGKIERAAR